MADVEIRVLEDDVEVTKSNSLDHIIHTYTYFSNTLAIFLNNNIQLSLINQHRQNGNK